MASTLCKSPPWSVSRLIARPRCVRRPENAARSVRRTLSAPYPVARSAPRKQRQCEHFASRRAGTEHRSKPPGGAPPSASALGPAPILGFRRARARRSNPRSRSVRRVDDPVYQERAIDVRYAARTLFARVHPTYRRVQHPPREFGATCETSVDFSLSAPHLSAGDRHHDNFRRQS